MGGAVNERIQQLEAALQSLLGMLDGLVAESGRGVEWGEEDAFRMGEWFEEAEMEAISAARSLITPPAMPAPQADVWPFEERW